MKHTLALVLMVFGSFGAFAEDDLPSVLYCEFSASKAEFHFNDEGRNWFKVESNHKRFNNKIYDMKNLTASSEYIRFEHRVFKKIAINRVTGGIQFQGASGHCHLNPPNFNNKF